MTKQKLRFHHDAAIKHGSQIGPPNHQLIRSFKLPKLFRFKLRCFSLRNLLLFVKYNLDFLISSDKKLIVMGLD